VAKTVRTKGFSILAALVINHPSGDSVWVGEKGKKDTKGGMVRTRVLEKGKNPRLVEECAERAKTSGMK